MSSLSHVRLFVTPWTVAEQAPLSMGFSRQEYWSELPFPSPGDLPDPEIKPGSPSLQTDTLPSKPPGKPRNNCTPLKGSQAEYTELSKPHFPIPGFYVCCYVPHSAFLILGPQRRVLATATVWWIATVADDNAVSIILDYFNFEIASYIILFIKMSAHLFIKTRCSYNQILKNTLKKIQTHLKL